MAGSNRERRRTHETDGPPEAYWTDKTYNLLLLAAIALACVTHKSSEI
jgi:hypothetical protein